MQSIWRDNNKHPPPRPVVLATGSFAGSFEQGTSASAIVYGLTRLEYFLKIYSSVK